MKRISTLTLLGLALAAPLAAQNPPDSARRGAPPMMRGPMMRQGGPGPMGHMMPMMDQGPMGRLMGYNPDHLLERKDALALTADQVTRLTALRDAAKSVHDAATVDAESHQRALTQALTATAADTAGVRQHVLAAHASMGNAHWAMVKAALQAKAVLNDAQRGRVEGWMDAMPRSEPQMGRRGGMPPEQQRLRRPMRRF